MRLTRWEGRDQDGPRAVLVHNERTWLENMDEAMRKLARYEDMEDAGGASPSPTEDGGANEDQGR